jgi:hypothetical protein
VLQELGWDDTWLKASICEMTPFSTVDTTSVCLILSCSHCGGWPLHTLIPRVGKLEVVVARSELTLRSLKSLTD